jgi:hypothetical protein
MLQKTRGRCHWARASCSDLYSPWPRPLARPPIAPAGRPVCPHLEACILAMRAADAVVRVEPTVCAGEDVEARARQRLPRGNQWRPRVKRPEHAARVSVNGHHMAVQKRHNQCAAIGPVQSKGLIVVSRGGEGSERGSSRALALGKQAPPDVLACRGRHVCHWRQEPPGPFHGCSMRALGAASAAAAAAAAVPSGARAPAARRAPSTAPTAGRGREASLPSGAPFISSRGTSRPRQGRRKASYWRVGLDSIRCVMHNRCTSIKERATPRLGLYFAAGSCCSAAALAPLLRLAECWPPHAL